MEYIILGISLVLWGCLTIINPKYYSHKFGMYFDFSGVEFLFGGLLIIIGIGFIYTEIRKKRMKS
jgi:hypothetical protein